MTEAHADDRLVLGALGGRDPQTSDEVAARIDQRKVDATRVGRWMASARRRELIDIEVDTDHIGRPLGSRRYGLNEAGARYYRQLVADEGSSDE